MSLRFEGITGRRRRCFEKRREVEVCLRRPLVCCSRNLSSGDVPTTTPTIKTNNNRRRKQTTGGQTGPDRLICCYFCWKPATGRQIDSLSHAEILLLSFYSLLLLLLLSGSLKKRCRLILFLGYGNKMAKFSSLPTKGPRRAVSAPVILCSVRARATARKPTAARQIRQHACPSGDLSRSFVVGWRLNNTSLVGWSKMIWEA